MIEKVKSGLMAILFASCLILSGFILYDGSATGSGAAMSVKTVPQEQLSELLNPQSCNISYGGGLYKGVYSAEIKQVIWQESKKYLKNYLEFTELHKISQRDWDTAVKSKSVSFVMPFDMTMDQMKAMLLSGSFDGSSDSPLLRQVVVPINEDDRIYVGHVETGSYYILKGVKRDTYLSTLLSDYEKDTGLFDTKTAEELYGLSKVLSTSGQEVRINNTLLPIASIPNIPFVRAEDELNLNQMTENQLKAYVSKAFGARNDFMKTLEDIDGSLVYLYGYSERALKIGSDGYITYNRRYEKATGGSNVNFKEGLSLAFSELAKFGDLPKSVYLSDYKRFKDKEGNWVNQYSFNYQMEQLPVYLADALGGEPLIVEMTGAQATSIKRKISQYVRTFSVEEIWDEPMKILDLMELNYDQISANYAKFDYKPLTLGEGESPGSNHFAISLLQSFNQLSLVYYQDKGKADSLIPAWYMQIGSVGYIVNLYSGEILKEIPPEGGK